MDAQADATCWASSLTKVTQIASVSRLNACIEEEEEEEEHTLWQYTQAVMKTSMTINDLREEHRRDKKPLLRQLLAARREWHAQLSNCPMKGHAEPNMATPAMDQD